MLAKLDIPAGLYANGTEYQSQGRWHDCNLVRWKDGYMGPVNGWIKFSNTQLTGRPSDIHQYRDGAARRGAVGTHTNLYAIKPSGTVSDITPTGYVVGRPSTLNNYGYGIGNYGTGFYGISTPNTGSVLPATNWTLDNFGNLLIACADTDGKLYQWDGIAAQATVISGAPINNNAVIVTGERFVMALGAAGNDALVQWADQESLTTWTPAATNQAGDFTLQTSGSILCAVRVRGQTLILTSTDAHTATYQGPPFVYGFERVGSGCGALGAQSVVSGDNFAAWMGRTGFFIFDGFVKPLASDVLDRVYSDLNMVQFAKVSGWHNQQYSEIWWHYPSSVSTECNRYVAWNYRNNTWSIGALNRSCGADEGVYDNPLLMSADGFIYTHEFGFAYDGAIPYAETGPFEIGNGEQVFMSRQLYPDEKTKGDIQALFRTRFYPNGAEYSYGPYSMSAPTDIRFSGRQMVMRIEAVRNTDWRFGVPRIDYALGGSR